MPFIKVSVSRDTMPRELQVTESSDIPPLPVSTIKVRLSCEGGIAAFTIITPPLNIRNGILDISSDLAESPAIKESGRKTNIMMQLIILMIYLTNIRASDRNFAEVMITGQPHG